MNQTVIAINGKRRQDQASASATAAFITELWERLGHPTLIMQQRYLQALCDSGVALPDVHVPERGEHWQADMAVSIGGDGTFLRTARWIGRRETPILGINSGHLGYLSDVSLTDSAAVIDEIAAGSLKVESRALIQVMAFGEHFDDPAGLMRYPYALNEVAVLRHDTASMISVGAVLDGFPLAVYQADGLLVSTPTGSTAYNLSVGGPIIAPSARCWAISPVAPHALTMRPMVVTDNSELMLKVDSRVPFYRLSLDGHSLTLPLGVKLKLSRAPFATRILVCRSHNFAGTLRTKLLWGIDGR